MVSISKIIGIMLCGFVLCLGLSNVASSADQRNTGQSDKQIFTVSDKDRFEAGKEVKGELVRVEGEKYFVREDSGRGRCISIDLRKEACMRRHDETKASLILSLACMTFFGMTYKNHQI